MLQKLYTVQAELDTLVGHIHNEVIGLSHDLIGQQKAFEGIDPPKPPEHFIGAIETQQLYTIRLLSRLYDEVRNLRGILHGEVEPVIGRPFNPTTEPVEKTELDNELEKELEPVSFRDETEVPSDGKI